MPKLSSKERDKWCEARDPGAQVGFQIRVFTEKGEPFDPDRTVYNKVGRCRFNPR